MLKETSGEGAVRRVCGRPQMRERASMSCWRDSAKPCHGVGGSFTSVGLDKSCGSVEKDNVEEFPTDWRIGIGWGVITRRAAQGT